MATHWSILDRRRANTNDNPRAFEESIHVLTHLDGAKVGDDSL